MPALQRLFLERGSNRKKKTRLTAPTIPHHGDRPNRNQVQKAKHPPISVMAQKIKRVRVFIVGSILKKKWIGLNRSLRACLREASKKRGHEGPFFYFFD
jgi:hypothetical protein